MAGDDARGRTGRWLPLRLAVLAVVVLVAVLVAILFRPGGPGSPDGDLLLDSYSGVPAGADDTGDFEPGWVLGEDGRLAVYVAGSSSCPWRPTAVTADGDLVTVQMEVDGGPECTADLGYSTSVVALPDGVDPAALDVEIHLVDR